MLARVGFPDPVRAMRTYPFELSGGLRQRAVIAMALICRPALVIADEPTTALDVTIQAQILKLLQDLQQSLGMAVLLITHDLGVVANMAEEVVVMYRGRVMESGPRDDLLRRMGADRGDPGVPFGGIARRSRTRPRHHGRAMASRRVEARATPLRLTD
jgi:peptide/nickel transport system ATP-binding protein